MKTFAISLCLVLLWCGTAVAFIMVLNPIRIAQMQEVHVRNSSEASVRVCLIADTDIATKQAPRIYQSRVPTIPAFSQKGIPIGAHSERKIFYIGEGDFTLNELLVSIGDQTYTVAISTENSVEIPKTDLEFASATSLEARSHAVFTNPWLVASILLIALLTPIATVIVVFKRWKANDAEAEAIAPILLEELPDKPITPRRRKYPYY
jgi:hypothetical protein